MKFPMFDGLPAWVGLASLLGATIAVFYLVFTGRLWVRAAHEDVVRVLQNQITAITTDRNNWQSAANLANQINADLAKTLRRIDRNGQVLHARHVRPAGKHRRCP